MKVKIHVLPIVTVGSATFYEDCFKERIAK